MNCDICNVKLTDHHHICDQQKEKKICCHCINVCINDHPPDCEAQVQHAEKQPKAVK